MPANLSQNLAKFTFSFLFPLMTSNPFNSCCINFLNEWRIKGSGLVLKGLLNDATAAFAFDTERPGALQRV